MDTGHGGNGHRSAGRHFLARLADTPAHVRICWSAGSGFWERSCRSSAWCRSAARRWRIVTLIFLSSACSSPWRSASAIWRTGFNFRKLAVTAAAALILAACLVLTENQLRYWRDSESLFAHALAVTKDNPYAHLNLAPCSKTKAD